MQYEDFLKTKQKRASFKSIEISRDELNGALFDYQKDLVYLALKKGHFAIFGVNLPRWGLKPNYEKLDKFDPDGVNLPRWGLKL